MQLHKKRFDLIAVGAFMAALFCLIVSLPATYAMAVATHGGLGVLLVLVLELIAFGSKASKPSVQDIAWKRILELICIALLAITLVANAVHGVDFLYSSDNTDLTPAWQAVRDWSPWNVPVGAIFLVGVTSALVPVGIYIFLSIFERRIVERRESATDVDKRVDAAMADAHFAFALVHRYNTELAKLALPSAQTHDNAMPRVQVSASPAMQLQDTATDVQDDMHDGYAEAEDLAIKPDKVIAREIGKDTSTVYRWRTSGRLIENIAKTLQEREQ